MDVTKAPLLDPNMTRTGSTPAPQQGAGSPIFAPLAPPQDRIDIQPLDLVAALQILIAEVRTELVLPVDAWQPQNPPQPQNPTQTAQHPTQTAQLIIHLLLEAVRDDAGDPARWSAASTRIDAVLQSALDRAVEVVAAWRNVPHAVVDAARETRALVAAQLSDEPPSPLWLRPEWLRLAPRIQRYWRRRRLARRGLTDPDSQTQGDAGGDRPDPPTLLES